MTEKRGWAVVAGGVEVTQVGNRCHTKQKKVELNMIEITYCDSVATLPSLRTSLSRGKQTEDLARTTGKLLIFACGLCRPKN